MIALTEQQRNDPLWQMFKAELESRLMQLRAGNDQDLNDSETAKLRGRIAEVKRMLDLWAVKPKIEVE